MPLTRATVAAKGGTVALTIPTPGGGIMASLTPAAAALLRADLRAALLALDDGGGA